MTQQDGVADEHADFLKDVIEGLSAPQKSLPCKYFYDARGSELFEQITKTREYYPTRTEQILLKSIATDISNRLGTHPQIIEYGAGALVKIRILLEALDRPVTYMPIDVSEAFLKQASNQLAKDYPQADVRPVAGEFLDQSLKIQPPDDGRQVMAFFPGSTLGNFADADIASFLKIVRGHVGNKGKLLLGVDINQEASTLIPAYNDREGITAAFNLNLLTRINNELGGDFNIASFSHEAVWNAEERQIEMYLISNRAQTASVGPHKFQFAIGERIHTENSRKFDLQALSAICMTAGWTIEETWMSPAEMFAMVLLKQSSL